MASPTEVTTHRHMTVGLVDFDSDVGRILVLLNTNGVCVTDSAKESDTREKVSVITLSDDGANQHDWMCICHDSESLSNQVFK